ncbi:MAG TPA: 16S rRNA (adenine(1518)-N(6)/adenine(1519)-N(6))-dimethyltransferase RsmA [Candidatus Dormibacteraeota bacterium]
MRQKKSLGQNWLIDEDLRERVLAAADVRPSDEVLEIGPGPGTLTDRLAERAGRLVAVELDGRLAARLRQRFATQPNVEIVEGDILRTDLRGLFPRGGEIVVGNIPYYLTGALLPKLLDDPPRPRRVSLVVQKEVAERWTAPTGVSTATVAVQLYTQARLALNLPAAAFDPPPKVDSALVVMEVRPRPALELADGRSFLGFVERVFQFRRKQLGGSLARVTGLSPSEVAGRLQELGVDPQRRPQTLSLEEWGAVHGGIG